MIAEEVDQVGIDKREQLAHAEKRRSRAHHLPKGHELRVAACAGLAGIAAFCAEDGGGLARLGQRPQRGLHGRIVAGGRLLDITRQGIRNVGGERRNIVGKTSNLVHQLGHIPRLGDQGSKGGAEIIRRGGIDDREDLFARAEQRRRIHPFQRGDIRLVAIAGDGGPNLGIKIDVLSALELVDDLMQPPPRHRGRQLVVLGLGMEGITAAG